MNDTTEDSESELQSVDGMQPLAPSEWEGAFDEHLSRTLDLDTWAVGENLSELYARLEAEVSDAVADEDRIRDQIRSIVFPRIATGRRRAPDSGCTSSAWRTWRRLTAACCSMAGLKPVTARMSSTTHFLCPSPKSACAWSPTTANRALGFTGSFAGICGSRGRIPFTRRWKCWRGAKSAMRSAWRAAAPKISELARRGIMAYAERAILLEKSTARWRMGHGNPTPYELLTGHWAHYPEMVDAALDLMYSLVLGHQRFVFVPSAPRRRDLLTIGNALEFVSST